MTKKKVGECSLDSQSNQAQLSSASGEDHWHNYCKNKWSHTWGSKAISCGSDEEIFWRLGTSQLKQSVSASIFTTYMNDWTTNLKKWDHDYMAGLEDWRHKWTSKMQRNNLQWSGQIGSQIEHFSAFICNSLTHLSFIDRHEGCLIPVEGPNRCQAFLEQPIILTIIKLYAFGGNGGMTVLDFVWDACFEDGPRIDEWRKGTFTWELNILVPSWRCLTQILLLHCQDW